MKVGIDARFVTRQPRRGIGNYSLCLMSEMVKLAPKTEFILYISARDSEGVLPCGPNVKVRQLATPSYPLWEQIALPLAAMQDKIDVLHSLGNTAPLILPNHVRLIITIHDVMFLKTGENFTKPANNYQLFGRFYRRFAVPPAARRADYVITMSDYSRSDILSCIPSLNPDRLQVSYQSCSPMFDVKEDAQGELNDISSSLRPYILTLGAEDPRKNTLRLVTAYLELLKNHSIETDLIISGYSNWENSASYQAVINAGAGERVKFLSFVSIEELATLYRNATFFVYPSLYEGFGIPILEAFSCGCPVIASKVTSIPEVCGEAALYIDPMNQQDIEQALLKLLSNEQRRRLLVQAGLVRAEKFSWQAAAEKTLAVYEKCMSPPLGEI